MELGTGDITEYTGEYSRPPEQPGLTMAEAGPERDRDLLQVRSAVKKMEQDDILRKYLYFVGKK